MQLFEDSGDDVLATLTPSTGRRWFAVVALVGLGVLLFNLAWTVGLGRDSAVWAVFLILCGAGAVWGALRLYRATGCQIELTLHELRDSNGRVLARIDNIASVERGAFAFKPSNGFLVRLKVPAEGRAWAPGLWWRLRRMVGVGGVTSGHEGKAMAETIALILADRKTD